jgi:hypothetical protein
MPLEQTWTIDSGCTRHVTHQAEWFAKMRPSEGSITVGGKNQIPIKGMGDAVMDVTDSKGKVQTLTMHNVLYAPDLRFSLFSPLPSSMISASLST